jgi:Ribosomally synthesized peptide prototyped by Frankia Franean1_4349.
VSPDFERLIGRAIVDKKFRKDLLDDPDAAVSGAGFSLTPDELAKLRDAVQKAGKKRKNDEIDEQFDAVRAGNW